MTNVLRLGESSMPPSLANIQDLRTVLGQLDAERPADDRPDRGRTLYEPRADDFLNRLDLELQSRRGKSRLLVTGQIGVGKSSELSRYFRGEKGERRIGFPVFCDLEKQESPEHCGATGVLLTMLRDCWGSLDYYLRHPEETKQRELRDDLARIRDEIVSRLIEHLNGSRNNDDVVFRFGGMNFSVSIADHRKNAALHLILAKAAQHEAVSDPADRFGVAPDAMVVLLNQLLRWMTKRFGDRPPTLIMDHVDKIRDPKAAEDVLVRAFTHWDRLEAALIMTAPYEFTLGELRNSVESRWGAPRVLYPLPIPEPDQGPVPAIFNRIAKNAGLSSLMPEESLRLMAHYSGGILRTYVQLLVAAAKEAHFSGHNVIESPDALTVIHAAERAYQDYSIEDFRLLDQVVNSDTGLRDAVTLLRSPIVLLVTKGEDNRQTLRVHPLAKRALERFQRKTRAIA
jgi:hypothetical protein